MKKIPYIVSAAVVVAVSLFVALEKYWTGLKFFVLGTLALLSLFWAGWLIYLYVVVYKRELDERFLLFKADIINKTHVTSSVFEQNLAAYKKEFKKQ